MIVLLQRVSQASVDIADTTIAQIGPGLLALVGFEKGDGTATLLRLAERILNYRIFSDDNGKMNLSLTTIGGELLLVPQFTLAADTTRGNRPGFSPAAAPADGAELFRSFCAHVKNIYPPTQCGRFGADMQVHLSNDGPVTIWLQQSPEKNP